MTKEEFNTEYVDYKEFGDGMTFEFPSIIHYVNEVFKDLIKIPGFKFRLISSRHGLAFVDTNLDEIIPFVGRIINQELEEKINFILKVEFEIKNRLLSLNLDENGRAL